MAVCQTSPKEFEDRLIFMSMFNYIDWTEKGNYKECTSNSVTVKNYAKKNSSSDIGLLIAWIGVHTRIGPIL